MYHGRPTLRWLLYLGTLGLAGLAPGRDQLPLPLVISALCLPIALCELGAELAISGTTARWRTIGARCQLAAATIFPMLLVAEASVPAPRLRGKPILIAVAALGAIASAIIWWDHGRARRGRAPVAADPLGAGERAASRAGFVDGLAVIGGGPFLLGAISAALVALALFALMRHRAAVPPDLWLALAFFTACFLVAVMQGMQRWEAYVPGSRIATWRLATQTAAFLLFGGALVGIALCEQREGKAGPGKVIFLAAVGAACVLAGAALVWRAWRPSKARPGYVLTREGLVETTRRGVFLFPWSSIEAAAIGELSHQVTLFIRLGRRDLVQGPWRSGVVVPEPVGRGPLAKRQRSIDWSRRLFDADLAVMATMVDQPIGDLYRAISSLLDNEAERAALPSMRTVPSTQA